MKDEAVGLAGSVASWTLTLADFQQTAQIISYIASALVSILTALYIIYKWYKRANADGKITKEEIEELKEDLKNDKDREQDL